MLQEEVLQFPHHSTIPPEIGSVKVFMEVVVNTDDDFLLLGFELVSVVYRGRTEEVEHTLHEGFPSPTQSQRLTEVLLLT